MRPKCPCKDCIDRMFNCHGKCSLYQAWKAELEKEAECRRKERDTRTDKKNQPFWRRVEKAKKR